MLMAACADNDPLNNATRPGAGSRKTQPKAERRFESDLRGACEFRLPGKCKAIAAKRELHGEAGAEHEPARKCPAWPEREPERAPKLVAGDEAATVDPYCPQPAELDEWARFESEPVRGHAQQAPFEARCLELKLGQGTTDRARRVGAGAAN